MAPNRIPEFPYQLAEYLEQSRRVWTTSTLYLGGTSGSGGGGSGGPPGGFVGQLVQTRVAYDSSELSTPTTGSFPSLLDNLNHIRWMITSGSYSGTGTLSGTGLANQVAYWTTGSALGGDPGLTYNPTTDRLTLLTSGSAAGLLLSDLLLYRKSSQKLGVGGAVDVDGTLNVGGVTTLTSTLSVGGVQIDTAGAVLNYVLTYDGTKYVGTPTASGASGISGSGTSPEVAYFTSGSVIASAAGLEYYPGGTSRLLLLWGGTHPAGVQFTVENATSGSLADALVRILTASGGGSPYILWETNTGYHSLGINPLTDELTLVAGFPYIPGRSGTNPVLKVTTSGSVYWTSNRQSWGGSFVEFNAPMRLDPTGATSGSLLGYDGIKWIPMSISSGTVGIPLDGWIDASETWTYVSADGPTGVFSVPTDVTGKYQPGMRVKYTQSTVKYGIITSGSFGGSNTQITIYGGTDYTTGSGAITSPYYSPVKSPYGFPMNPSKWTIELLDASSRSQTSPTQNVWYNNGSLSISVPIGSWYVSYEVTVYASKIALTRWAQVTLSTANNSESDADLTASCYQEAAGAAGGNANEWPVHREKLLLLTTKASYYLNIRSQLASMAEITYAGGDGKTAIRATCGYL